MVQHDSVESVRIPAGDAIIDGDLAVPANARGVVLFAHGSGSGRHSPRNIHVAGRLREASFATLLIDLLTRDEEAVDMRTRALRFDIDLLARRLIAAIDWLSSHGSTRDLEIGCFGASTGAAAALLAAAERPDAVSAVVSRGGRPDLADGALPRVRAPTLLIVGGLDTQVLALNRTAMGQMHGQVELEIVAGATHLFEESGTLETVTDLARDWFAQHLASRVH